MQADQPLSPLERLRSARPVVQWLVSVAVTAVLVGIWCWVQPPKKGVDLVFLLWLPLSMSLTTLVRRLSDTKQRRFVQDEALVGQISVGLSALSLLCMTTLTLDRRLGIGLPESVVRSIPAVFGISVMLAGALGYAGLRTRPGRLGVTLVAAWGLVLIIGLIYALIKRGLA